MRGYFVRLYSRESKPTRNWLTRDGRTTSIPHLFGAWETFEAAHAAARRAMCLFDGTARVVEA